MNNHELRTILIKELGLGSLLEEEQNDVLGKVGTTVLQSLTRAIFEKLSSEAREEFENISTSGDEAIQEFLDDKIPDLHEFMEIEVKKAIALYKEEFIKSKMKEGEAPDH